MIDLQYSYSRVKYKYLKDFIFNTHLKYVLLPEAFPTIELKCCNVYNTTYFKLLLQRVEDYTAVYKTVIPQIGIKYKNTILYPQLCETGKRTFKVGEFKDRVEAENYLGRLLSSVRKHVIGDSSDNYYYHFHYYEILNIVE